MSAINLLSARLTALLRLAALALPLVAGASHADDFLEPAQAFKPAARVIDAQTIEVGFNSAPGYYLYRSKFKFISDSADIDTGSPQFPKGKLKNDEMFGEVEVYSGKLLVPVPLSRRPAEATPLRLQVSYQGCAEAGICYPPQTTEFKLRLPAVVASSAAASPPAAAPAASAAASDASASKDTNQDNSPASSGDEAARITDLLKNAGFWLVLASFFGFGVLLSLTPCIFPMIPILSGIIVGSGKPGQQLSRGRGFLLALAYVLGMAVTYAAAGVAAGLTGTLFANALQNAWVLGAFALLFVVLSLSMFGFYELQLPGFLQSKVSDEANHLQGGSLPAVAVMGMLSALICGPCVAAPLAGALLYIGQSGDALLGGAALFVLALGMGMPLLLVGLSAGTLLPRAGAWMEAVKKTFGVIMLATGLWFVQPVLPPLLSMFGWAALCIIPAIYLHALDPLPANARGWQRFWKGSGVIMLLYGSALLAGSLAGNRDPLQPLTGLASSSATAAENKGTHFQRVASVAELDTALAKAASAGQPVMLDFYADWCVSCKELEHNTFKDRATAARLGQYLLLQADVTANNSADAALLKRFNLFGPPGMVFFDQRGQEIKGLRGVGYLPPAEFGQLLDKVDQRLKSAAG